MTAPEPSLPSGVELDAAIAEAEAGRLSADEFGQILRKATLMLAVTDRAGETSASPFVIQIGGADHAVAFTGQRHYEGFTASTPFLLLRGADLATGWPAGLGLALNPGAEPSMAFSADQLRGLVAPGEAVVPAGSTMKVGAPDPGLPPPALDLLRRIASSDPQVRAAYQLAVAVGDGPVELVVGVHAAHDGAKVARRFADRVADADPGFRGMPFLDLDGWLLEAAREHSVPLG